jgi:hypothetical protein
MRVRISPRSTKLVSENFQLVPGAKTAGRPKAMSSTSEAFHWRNGFA